MSKEFKVFLCLALAGVLTYYVIKNRQQVVAATGGQDGNNTNQSPSNTVTNNANTVDSPFGTLVQWVNQVPADTNTQSELIQLPANTYTLQVPNGNLMPYFLVSNDYGLGVIYGNFSDTSNFSDIVLYNNQGAEVDPNVLYNVVEDEVAITGLQESNFYNYLTDLQIINGLTGNDTSLPSETIPQNPTSVPSQQVS